MSSVDWFTMRAVRAELERRGVPVEAHKTAQGYELRDLVGHGVFALQGLAEQVQSAKEANRDEIIINYVNRLLSNVKLPRAFELTTTELHRRLRTVVLPAPPMGAEDVAYARPLAPGLVVALGLDYDGTPTTLHDAAVAKIRYSSDELFEIAQANTDAEPIGVPLRRGDGLMALSGYSSYVAAKAAHLDALVPDVIGAAPLGVVFAVPDRNELWYQVLSAERWSVEISALTRTITSFANTKGHHVPGGLLSAHSYYWAPGGVDVVSQLSATAGIQVASIALPQRLARMVGANAH